MKLLKSLFENNGQVWIYCENQAYQEKFLKQAEEEGFLALNGQKPTEMFRHQLYGINDDMTIGYLAVMIWTLTFQTGKDSHLRVDYGKYISGDDDFICHTAHLKRVSFSDWNKIAYVTIDSGKFEEMCNHFIDGQEFEDYQAYIYRYLMESSWQYSPERAAKIVEEESGYISQCYNERVSVSDCAVEIGYGCG